MRRPIWHPLAELLMVTGWPLAAIPVCAFAGAVTFASRFGLSGAAIGLFAGASIGVAFAVAWQWISHRTAPSQASVPPDHVTPSRAPERRSVPLSVPPPGEAIEITRGAAALGTMDLVSTTDDFAGNGDSHPPSLIPLSAAEMAAHIQRAALADDVDQALARLQDAWMTREHLFLDPSTALAIGERAALQGDSVTARWCLTQGKGANAGRLSALEKRLDARMTNRSSGTSTTGTTPDSEEGSGR